MQSLPFTVWLELRHNFWIIRLCKCYPMICPVGEGYPQRFLQLTGRSQPYNSFLFLCCEELWAVVPDVELLGCHCLSLLETPLRFLLLSHMGVVLGCSAVTGLSESKGYRNFIILLFPNTVLAQFVFLWVLPGYHQLHIPNSRLRSLGKNLHALLGMVVMPAGVRR